jgi:hypothetical protein
VRGERFFVYSIAALVSGVAFSVLTLRDWRRRRWGNVFPALTIACACLMIVVSLELISSVFVIGISMASDSAMYIRDESVLRMIALAADAVRPLRDYLLLHGFLFLLSISIGIAGLIKNGLFLR